MPHTDHTKKTHLHTASSHASEFTEQSHPHHPDHRHGHAMSNGHSLRVDFENNHYISYIELSPISHAEKPVPRSVRTLSIGFKDRKLKVPAGNGESKPIFTYMAQRLTDVFHGKHERAIDETPDIINEVFTSHNQHNDLFLAYKLIDNLQVRNILSKTEKAQAIKDMKLDLSVHHEQYGGI